MKMQKTLNDKKSQLEKLENIADLFPKFLLRQEKTLSLLDSHFSKTEFKTFVNFIDTFQPAFDFMKKVNLDKVEANQDKADKANSKKDNYFMDYISNTYKIDNSVEKVNAIITDNQLKVVTEKEKEQMPEENCYSVEIDPNNVLIGIYHSRGHNTIINAGNSLASPIVITSNDIISGKDTIQMWQTQSLTMEFDNDSQPKLVYRNVRSEESISELPMLLDNAERLDKNQEVEFDDIVRYPTD